jgi:hypothetical protein
MFVKHWTKMTPEVCHMNNFDSVKINIKICQFSFSFSFLVFKDRLPKMTQEDLFVLTKLFEIEGLIDYRSILDDALGNGILRHITQLPVPPPKQIVLEKKSLKELIRPSNEPLQLNHPK